MIDYVVYHDGDLDGWCSGAIAYLKLTELGRDVRLVPFDYGYSMSKKLFPDAGDIYFLDFFPHPYVGTMAELKACASGEVIVIDHHATLIDSGVCGGLRGIRRVGDAACELAWEYFHPHESMPWSVRLLGRYDVWDNLNVSWWEQEILPFQFGSRVKLSNPCVSLDTWVPFFSWGTDELDACVVLGKGVLAYMDSRDSKVVASCAFESDVGGLHVIACNDGAYSSNTFNSIWDPTKYDAMLGYKIRSDGKAVISLYATDPEVDCSVVAKSFGGGGHKHACGWIMERDEFFKLIFK